jgi:hypothetical protein
MNLAGRAEVAAASRGQEHQRTDGSSLSRPGLIPVTVPELLRLLYEDDTAYPTEIEIGLLRGGTLHVERSRNRYLSVPALMRTASAPAAQMPSRSSRRSW